MTDSGAARKMTRAKLVVLGRDNCGKTGNNGVHKKSSQQNKLFLCSVLSVIVNQCCLFSRVLLESISDRPVFFLWVSAYRLLCLTKALCVRFITKRFIGEYDHKKGKENSLWEYITWD